MTSLAQFITHFGILTTHVTNTSSTISYGAVVKGMAREYDTREGVDYGPAMEREMGMAGQWSIAGTNIGGCYGGQSLEQP
jgi:hypothetical protein